MSHPPKPRLTLRVGLVGHRPNKLQTVAVERIERQLLIVFAAIDAAACQILAADNYCYSSEPPAIRLVSGFAEGADQLAVLACPTSWQVEAVLPFPRDKHLDDFNKLAADGAEACSAFGKILKRANTVTALSPITSGSADNRQGHTDKETRHRDKGYADAGSYFLRQIDVLIAVWDGKPPKTAGTGAIAKHAFEGGVPVVWLSTQHNHVPRLIKGFDEHGDPIAPDSDCTNGPLASVLQSIFVAPSNAPRDSRNSARAGLEDFYGEDWRECCYFPFFDILKRFANGQQLRYVIRAQPFEKLCHDWDKFIASAPDVIDLQERLRQVLLPRYVWADSLAIYFSHHYRSAYVLAYGLSALAVFVALGGLFADSLDAKAAFVLFELIIIGAIIQIIRYGRRWRWHERWLEYRALAEALRHGRFIAFVSEFGHLHDRLDEGTRLESPWTLWYIRATMREVGLPTATLDGTYQWRLLNATLRHEIHEQLNYHEGNRGSVHKIDHMLHSLGVICFSIAFGILSVFFIGYVFEYALTHIGATAQSSVAKMLSGSLLYLKSAMIFFSAGLPALGAALAGIRVHGDFEGSKERSDRMIDTLTALEHDYRMAMDRDIGLNESAEMLIRTTRLMSEDVIAWQELYGRKRLTLPA
jgi:hypothetical protein